MNRNAPKSTFMYALLACCFVVIVASFYRFYFNKDFDYIVETSCDPASQTCFYRDCSNPDTGCPPNNLSNYKKFTIKASDFPKCANEDCTQACENNTITCIPIKCTDDELNSGACVAPSIPQ